MCSTKGIQTSLWMGCPIRSLKAHRLYAAPLERFAGLRVLHRLSAPRHPPRPLCSLLCIHLLTSSLPLPLQEETMEVHVCPLLLFCSAVFSAKLKLCCMKLSKCFLLARVTLLSRGACILSHIFCDVSIPFFVNSGKVGKISPNILQGIDEDATMEYACRWGRNFSGKSSTTSHHRLQQ